MRKLVMTAAISLLATQAYAGGSRSLSVAATNANEQTAATTPQATVTTTTTTPMATPPAQTTAPAATTEPKTTASSKPRHREPSVEARVIRELHRHGIYW
ncbi:hypothetical protein [Bradyrhizobium sp. Ec3.3]|uniref:hypothetical protein n=1 Tax=Bradyrhizobium sp. Ec3.3 TaxID=189753 RepID=UPI000403D711|nr:hypothetical protein [Bradyrhizobium sp. Ec3.3]